MRKLTIGLLSVGILLTMGAVRVADFLSARAETIRTAELRASNLALILSEYLSEAFAASDATLRHSSFTVNALAAPPPRRATGCRA